MIFDYILGEGHATSRISINSPCTESLLGGKYFPPTVGTCLHRHMSIHVEGCPKHVEDPLHLGLTVYKITRSVWWEKTSLRLLSEWLILVAHSINAAVRQSQPCKFFFRHCTWLLGFCKFSNFSIPSWDSVCDFIN